MNSENLVIAVIGLGYVGLPLAVEFGQDRRVIGFDTNEARVAELRLGLDKTREVSKQQLNNARLLEVTSDPRDIQEANCYIITVPTPIDGSNRPDLGPLQSATKTVGRALSEGDLVIYESTVFPGCTEEFCVPLLEDESGLKYRTSFHCGYSPERINPGDSKHRLPDIVKVTSGSSPETANTVDELYQTIIKAGTHKAESIRVAEAAKVIENTQRDLNIALINELSIIFNKLDIDTESVLRAAGTKWNFLPFRPGLVGGHCIGVDPYYLTYKAQEIGYEPEIILSGRRLNDGMFSYVVLQFLNALRDRGIAPRGARVLILGLAFKENTPDFRNSQVAEIVDVLHEKGMEVDVFDPVVDADQVFRELGIKLAIDLSGQKYDGIILAVAHDFFFELSDQQIEDLRKPLSVVYDLKYVFPPHLVDLRL